ncbi:MAG: hypothetical protein AAGI11_03695 [Pseudomonadota bacterium]
MAEYALLVSPEARSAYFADYLDVARHELAYLADCDGVNHVAVGGMDFLALDVDAAALPDLRRLSFVQGVFDASGGALRPLDVQPGFAFNDELVFGAKYRGKTNERLTQLLINIGLASLDQRSDRALKLLDPMCGRGTTLLWAMRYGLNARGIERDGRVLSDVRRELKKWCKLNRHKHQLNEGSVGKGGRDKAPRFLEFKAAEGGMKIVAGDAREANGLLGGEKFDLLVTDLPYGVQHATQGGARNPLEVLRDCAGPWRACLKPGGVLVMSFNSYQPRRDALLAAFEAAGWQAQAFSAPHRMSEAILRDVLVLR